MGLAIESLSEELEEVETSDGKDLKRKYTMKQLLDKEFRVSSDSSWGIEEYGDLDFSHVGGVDGIIYDEVK